MLAITLVLLGITLFICWKLAKGSALYAEGLKQGFTSPPALPIIGHAIYFWGDEVHIFKTSVKLIEELGSRVLFKVMDQIALEVADAEAMEAIMTSKQHIRKGFLYNMLLPWLGRGLLTNFGSSWHRRRKLLTSAFHFKILDEFGPMLAQHAKSLVNDLHDLSQSTKEAVNVVRPVSITTLRSICETAMGVDLRSCGNEEEYFKAVQIMGKSVLHRLIRPWTWSEFTFHLTPYGRKTKQALEFLHAFTWKVIQERKSSLQSQGKTRKEGVALRKRRLVFLDMLLMAQIEDPSLTDEAIREETDTFMFEGHDTTAMGVCWTLFALGNNPAIQERVREEVLSESDDWQKVMALPYLEMVIKESLRLYPPVLYIERQGDQDLQMGKQRVPVGTNLAMNIFIAHRNPASFPDPLRFDPERFSPDQEQGRHPFAYVPFSGGLRNCIGKRYAMMELKLMVAEVLRTFSIKSLHSEKEIVFRPELVLKADQGILLHLEPLQTH